MNKELRYFIEKEIIPQYKNFDKAHNLCHVRSVIEESLKLAPYYNANEDICYTVAAYHDIGLPLGRENHHTASAAIARNDKRLSQWFDSKQIETIAEAIEDHRASAKKPPRSIYGIIVAEADRNLDPILTIRRTIQYGLNKMGEATEEENYQRMKAHLMEKYAEGGYLKLYSKYSQNATKLANLREIINDEQKLRKIFKEIYEEEIRNLHEL